uniref:Integrase core domain containing protein n=1 Tax=Solanum tuberosum TaxID=4113 RepID=M1DJ60_SOLTU
MARTVTEERRVLTKSLHTMPTNEELFKRHKSDTLLINTIEYDYRMGIVQSGEFQRDAKKRETLLREASVPIWHCDRLTEATKTVYIDLIRDDANLTAMRREPYVDLPPLGVDLAEDVEHIQADDTTIPHSSTDAQPPSLYRH